MSHRPTSLRRALAVTLAVTVGPVALVAVPLGVAHAVNAPTSVDVPLTDAAKAIAFDDGRLLTTTTNGGTSAVRADSLTVPLVGQVTIATGAASYSGTVASSPTRRTIATSAELDVIAVASTGRVLVRRGTTTVLDVPAPAGSTWSVDVSGPYLRVGTQVYDVRRGASAILGLPGTAQTFALYGTTLVWSEQDGAVRVRDLATGATTTLRNNSGGCACPFQVGADASTVVYGRSGGSLSIWDLEAGIGRSNALALGATDRFRLADGFVATMGTTGIAFYRLNDPLTLSVATPYLPTDHVADLAFDGHAFAYLRTDGTVTVAQLPNAADGDRRPLVLASSVPLAFSPNGDRVADAWTPSFVLTQRMTTWRLEVVDPSTSSPVANFTSAPGAQPTANIAASWTPPAGRAASTYRWTLTGTGPDGEVRTSAGTTVGGVVTLRRTNPQPTYVSAPADIAVAGTGTRTPLAWRPAAFPAGVGPASYDVEYRSVRISKGKRAFGTPRRVATNTTRRASTFGAGAGTTTQFRARTKDTLGLVGPWSAWAASSTPLDDRSSALRYSKGWKWKRVAGRWAATERIATKSKRSVQVSRAASGFALVMRTGPTCGYVNVFVDGKLRRTVSLAGAAASRREVYSVTFKKLRKHTIKVVTVTKGKRKTVALDAVLVRH